SRQSLRLPKSQRAAALQFCVQVLLYASHSHRCVTEREINHFTLSDFNILFTCTADFRCKDRRRCVPRRQVCDGRAQCHDGSDELNCVGEAPVAPKKADLKCRVGSRLCRDGTECVLPCDDGRECVLYSHVCDGEEDCLDGSDEKGCQEDCKQGFRLKDCQTLCAYFQTNTQSVLFRHNGLLLYLVFTSDNKNIDGSLADILSAEQQEFIKNLLLSLFTPSPTSLQPQPKISSAAKMVSNIRAISLAVWSQMC
uniref:Uncharacterized protein n=1 Tax=Oryzias latipes TaxID=8090 RepID=A0A3P9M3K5_ORYLA